MQLLFAHAWSCKPLRDVLEQNADVGKDLGYASAGGRTDIFGSIADQDNTIRRFPLGPIEMGDRSFHLSLDSIFPDGV